MVRLHAEGPAQRESQNIEQGERVIRLAAMPRLARDSGGEAHPAGVSLYGKSLFTA